MKQELQIYLILMTTVTYTYTQFVCIHSPGINCSDDDKNKRKEIISM